MMCGENAKETVEEQYGEENQTYEAENTVNTISPIQPSSNNFPYGSTDLIRRKSLIPQEIAQPNPPA